ncbi:hypothetical protein M441DRAFT_255177 [Trichoderma asperellum CBS 433.97]|uniref:Uncharacterized protein n=1 Tax=Trichoderma asperellum (strain ATCC 204424 / CBS 433.97 / NBRC 101777) TaxID=1042311 RepID=A0A2T3YYK1_TRIA4|nr:hypothetical protein M441DRAFT_255177 [Trichoderma asperellum CBS 433.97]PTB37653.1 hypothetical protein M441DRAFT_255177 [Trichoderma asperellum CBS 433.97]
MILPTPYSKVIPSCHSFGVVIFSKNLMCWYCSLGCFFTSSNQLVSAVTTCTSSVLYLVLYCVKKLTDC